MAITGATIRTALNSRLSKTVALNGLNSEITQAVNDIARIALWPDLHTTDTSTLAFTADDKSKALPTDVHVLDRVYLPDDRVLFLRRIDWIRRRQEQSNPSTGKPYWYAEEEDEVFVYPIPDAAHTCYCDYWKIIALITDETAALAVGDDFKEAVITATIVHYLKTSGLNAHPKLAENQGLFRDEIGLLLPEADRKITVVEPFVYGAR